MSSIFRSVSRWTIKFNGVQSLPNDYSYCELFFIENTLHDESSWNKNVFLAFWGYFGVNETKTKTWNFSSKPLAFFLLSLVSYAVCQCDFPLFEMRRRFLSAFTVLSPSGAREVSRAIGAFLVNIFKVEKKRQIREELEDRTCDNHCRTLQRLTSYRLRHKHHTRCACVSVDTQNPRFLSLKTRTNTSIMCTSRYSQGKLSKDSILRILAYVKMRSITFIPVE